MVALTVAVSCGDVSASAVVDVARAVADVAGIECTDAGVDVVADAVTIGVG